MREYVLWQSQHTPATLDAMPSGWELPEETSTPAQGGSFVFSSRSTGWSTLKSLYHTSNSYPPWEVSQLVPTILELIPLQAGSLNLLTLLPRSFTLTAIFPSTKENSHAFPRLADWYHWLHPAVEGTGKLDPGLRREGLPAQLFASLCVTNSVGQPPGTMQVGSNTNSQIFSSVYANFHGTGDRHFQW